MMWKCPRSLDLPALLIWTASYGCTALGELRRWVGCTSVYYTLAWYVDYTGGVCGRG